MLRHRPNLDRCRAQYIGPANDDCSLATHVGLPALNIEVVRAVDLEYNPTAVRELPFGIQIADSTVLVGSFDLPVRLLYAEATAEAEKIDLTQRLGPAADVAERFTQVTLVADSSDMPHRLFELVHRAQPLLNHCRQERAGKGCQAAASMAARGEAVQGRPATWT